MRILRGTLTVLAMLPLLGGMAQSRDALLNLEVVSVPEDNIEGQQVEITQTDYSVGYGTIKLDSEGKCTTKLYGGNHLLKIERSGFKPISHTFAVSDGETCNLKLSLEEATRDPYAITATAIHDPLTGKDHIDLQWNIEKPAFFDDFESYEPFSIKFGDWTGIDADGETTAALVGSYPNRGTLQYCQIINPLTVIPTWWYDYPVLRPYSGQQYAGFIRTSSGSTNNDWLITPEISVGVENVFKFLAKCADRYAERFMVYVTEKTDNPTIDDFIRLDKGNFESADSYANWTEFCYDLSAYAGKNVKLAIRYISDASRYGAFMLMVDDVYVGPDKESVQTAAKARRVHRSPANANERFEILLDGVKVHETEDYTCTLQDVPAGRHTIGIKAIYLHAESATSTVEVETGTGRYAALTINVTANSRLQPEGTPVKILNHADASQISVAVKDGKVILPSLPHGTYDVCIEEGAYEAYVNTIDVDGDMTLDVALTDNMLAPYNVTATNDDDGNVTLRWNQTLIFDDSFEEYDDFATGSFGEWITVDRDNQPVYPIALGDVSNVVTFPGSGTATNPTACAPMVFNPWMTTPAMMPADPAINAFSGEKMVIFFSSQMAQNDKWLISPLIDINDDYQVKFVAKAYSIYPESFNICISDGSTNPADFQVIATIEQLASSQWGEYTVPLNEYAGKSVRVALQYTSYDAMLAQVDDFSVGPVNGEGEIIEYGNVEKYEVYLDGNLVAEPTEPFTTLTDIEEGQHTADIYAVYRSGRSDKGSVTFGTSGVNEMPATDYSTGNDAEYYDITGRHVRPEVPGIYIRRQGNKATRMMIR